MTLGTLNDLDPSTSVSNLSVESAAGVRLKEYHRAEFSLSFLCGKYMGQIQMLVLCILTKTVVREMFVLIDIRV